MEDVAFDLLILGGLGLFVAVPAAFLARSSWRKGGFRRYVSIAILMALVGLALLVWYGPTERDATRVAKVYFEHAIRKEGLRASDFATPLIERRKGRAGWDVTYLSQDKQHEISITLDRSYKSKLFVRNGGGAYRSLALSE